LLVHFPVNLFEELGVCISHSPRKVGRQGLHILGGVIRGVPGQGVVSLLVETEVVGREGVAEGVRNFENSGVAFGHSDVRRGGAGSFLRRHAARHGRGSGIRLGSGDFDGDGRGGSGGVCRRREPELRERLLRHSGGGVCATSRQEGGRKRRSIRCGGAGYQEVA
jgi:hypothetical protein